MWRQKPTRRRLAAREVLELRHALPRPAHVVAAVAGLRWPDVTTSRSPAELERADEIAGLSHRVRVDGAFGTERELLLRRVHLVAAPETAVAAEERLRLGGRRLVRRVDEAASRSRRARTRGPPRRTPAGRAAAAAPPARAAAARRSTDDERPRADELLAGALARERGAREPSGRRERRQNRENPSNHVTSPRYGRPEGLHYFCSGLRPLLLPRRPVSATRARRRRQQAGLRRTWSASRACR